MALVLAISLLTGCEPFGPGAGPIPDAPLGEGELTISPSELDFGDVSITQEGSASRNVTFENVGESPLVVSGLDQLDPAHGFAIDAPPVLQLAPGERQIYTVTFTPTEHGDYHDDLWLSATAGVSVRGHGAAPVLLLSDDALNFPDTPAGCESAASLTLSNLGDEALLLDDVRLTDNGYISLVGDPPVVIEAGESADVEFRFAPGEARDDYAAALHVLSNAPNSDQLAVGLFGSSHESETIYESFDYLPEVRADVLFAIDSTESTAGRLAAAQHALAQLEDVWEDGLTDWQVAVVNGESDCYATDVPWLARADGGSLADFLSEAFAASGGGEPKLLERARSAVERTDPGDCLDGFTRTGSLFHLILVTDRQETSPDEVEVYLDDMHRQVPASEGFVVSAITGEGDGACPYAQNAREAAQRTSGEELDLCAPDWEGDLQALAEMTVSDAGRSYTHALSHPPMPGTLQIWDADGAPVESWTWANEGSAITLSGDANDLPLGETLNLEYRSAIECY